MRTDLEELSDHITLEEGKVYKDGNYIGRWDVDLGDDSFIPLPGISGEDAADINYVVMRIVYDMD